MDLLYRCLMFSQLCISATFSVFFAAFSISSKHIYVCALYVPRQSIYSLSVHSLLHPTRCTIAVHCTASTIPPTARFTLHSHPYIAQTSIKGSHSPTFHCVSASVENAQSGRVWSGQTATLHLNFSAFFSPFTTNYFPALRKTGCVLCICPPGFINDASSQVSDTKRCN